MMHTVVGLSNLSLDLVDFDIYGFHKADDIRDLFTYLVGGDVGQVGVVRSISFIS